MTVAVSPAFDAHHPPETHLIDDCVHCGFCLPTCPTYVLFGEEMDSPRGRIYLMKEGLEGEPLTGAMVEHFDLCLGCMACVTACPSGVQYGKLIEATRGQVERRHDRSLDDRLFRELIFQLFPYPGRLRAALVAMAVYQSGGLRRLARWSGLRDRMPERFQALEALMPELSLGGRSAGRAATVPGRTAPQGQARRTVGLVLGCVQRVFFPHVNAATARVLAADGCAVVAPRNQGCCGALSLHAGRESEAQRFARDTIDVFERTGVDNVVINAAGCGSTLKEYGYLLRDDPNYAERANRFSQQVRDATELLSELGSVAPRQSLPLEVVYHDACHLAHGQGIRAQPRALLRAIPGVELMEVAAESDICCGSAGIYNLVQPLPARELGERKARNVLKTGAQLVVSSNPGCLLQIRAAMERLGESIPTAHPLEVLDASIRGQPVDTLLNGLAHLRRT